MTLRFTKMQGAGNDFVVLDATRAPIALSAEQLRRLADRRFGIGCDQILMIGPSPAPGIDFSYRIFNGGSGDEVEHCGNGARCLMRYLHDKGLADKRVLKVQTPNATIELRLQDDGRVSVDMNSPIFDSARVPFDAGGLRPREVNGFCLWPVEVEGGTVDLAVLSMGNPHAVQVVDDVDTAAVATLGPQIESHARFPRGVNVGFLQIVDRGRARLRVFERGAGETLACGTGACAAVVAGIRLGRLDAKVEVETRGGVLTVEWRAGEASGWTASEASSDTAGPMRVDTPVLMTGPAETVFEGEMAL